MSEAVEVREAVTAADREAVFRVRYDAYVDGMGLFTDIADHENRWLSDEHDETAHLLLATIGGEPQGTMRITCGEPLLGEEFEEWYDVSRWCPEVVAPEQVLVLWKFAVRQQHRGGMVPFALMRGAVEFGIAQGAELAFCDCQPHLVSLYTGLGFRSYRAAWSDAQVATTVPLVLVIRDFEHLRLHNSPLLSFGVAGLHRTPVTEEILKRFPSDAAAQSAQEGLALLRRMTELATVGRGVSLLDGLTDDELNAVIERGQVLTLKSGDPLIGRGQGTRTLYVVLSGEFRVMGVDGLPLATLTTGQPIGELAFLLRRERTTDVQAASDGAQVLALSERTINTLIEERGPVAAKLLHSLARTLAERLTSTYF
jgi:predicted GNAT family N-acyltransferase